MIRRLLGDTLPQEFKQAYALVVQYFVRRAAKRANDRYIKQLLASRKPIYLELGAGSRKGENGWVTSDICRGADLRIDLLEPFPFPDNSIDKIYSSHVFEHFHTHQLEFILSECRRVLKPGGVISVCVPNAEIHLNAYNNPDAFDPDRFCRYKPGYRFYSKIDYINYIAYMGGHHFHMFDQENLIQLLKVNGFRKVSSRGFDPELDLQARDYESIYVQGKK